MSFVAAMVAALPLFAATGEYRAAVLADGPSAYYPLDETSGTTATDLSGNGNHATYNSVTLGNAGALGSATAAATFDGSSSYIQIPGTWGGGSAITIEAWVNIAGSTGQPQTIVGATTADFVHLNAATGNTEFYIDGGGPQSLGIAAGTPGWQHVVVVIESGASKLYLNGSQVNSNVSAFSTIDAASDVRIGVGLSGGRWLNGMIDEVAIYDTALTAAQIGDHFSAQADGPFTTSGSGSWSAAGTWTNGRVPSSTDDVTINAGHTVTVDSASVMVNTLTVLGTLDVSSFGLTCTNDIVVAGVINGTADLTLAGTTGSQLIGLGTINAPVLFDGPSLREIPAGESPDLTGGVTVDGGVLNNGEVTLTAASGITGGGNWNQGSTGTLHIEGPIDVAGFGAAMAGNTVDYTGASQTVRATTYHHLTATGSFETRTLAGPITVDGDLTIEGGFHDDGQQITGGSGTLTVADFAELHIGTFNGANSGNGTSLPTFSTYALDPGSDVSYDANAAQTVASAPVYGNLAINAANTPGLFVKTADGAISVASSLSVLEATGADVELDIGAFALTIAGDLGGNGTIDTSGGAVDLQGSNSSFTGIITPTYDITFSGGNAQDIRGTAYNSVTINKSAGVAQLAGAASMTFLAINGGTLFDNNFQITGGVGNLFMASGATLRIAASFPNFGSYPLDLNSSVVYEGDGAQTIAGAPLYGHLLLSTGNTNATKSLDGASLSAQSLNLSSSGAGTVLLDLAGKSADIDGDINANGDINLNSGTLTIGGDFIHIGNWDGTGSVVTYDGAGAQVVLGTTYEDLVFNKSGGTASFSGDATVTNLFDLNTGTVTIGGNTIDTQGFVEIDGTLDLDTGIFKAGGSGLNVNGTVIPGSASALWVTASTPQQWTGSASALTLNSLVIDGTGGVNVQTGAGFDVTVNSVLNLSGGGNVLLNAPRKLTVASTGTVTRTAGAVQGTLAIAIPAGQTRRYEVASYSSATYSPVEITSTNAATVAVFAGDASATQRVDRVWTLSGDPSTLDLTFEWTYTGYTGDTRGFVPARFASSNWTFPAGYVDVTNAPNYAAHVDGVAAYDGDWTAGWATTFGGVLPSIGSFDPTLGPSGSAVTLYGSNFAGASNVAFNGVSDPGFTISSDNEIAATVPAGATTGTISVTNGSGSGTSFASFNVAAPQTISTAAAGNWDDTNTWQGGVVPNAWDNAIINHDVTINVPATINDLQLNTNLAAGAGSLRVDGTMSWNSGLISADLEIGSGATLDILNLTLHEMFGATLTNDGTINLTSAGLFFSNGGALDNDGTINIAGDYNLGWNGVGGAATLENGEGGVIVKTAGAGTTLLGGTGATVNNVGVIRADSGTLALDASVTTQGLVLGESRSGRRITANPAASQSFDVADGATLQFSAPADFQSGTDFSGSGTVLIAAAADFHGGISASATNFLLDANAAFTWNTATFTGGMSWKQGSFTGALTNAVGSAITAASAPGTRVLTGITFQNDGTFNVAANVTITNAATFTNNGAVDVQGDHTFGWDNGGAQPAIQNDGTIVKSSGGGTAAVGGGALFASSDTLRSQSGTLRISSSGTIAGTVDAANAGTTVELNTNPSFATGITFAGSGTVLVNSGAEFTGTVTQTAALFRIDTTSAVTMNAVTFSGPVEWKDAVIDGDTLTIAGGSIWSVISGGATPAFDAIAVTNQGTLNLTGNSVALANAASFDNQVTLDIQGDYDFRWNSDGGQPSIANNGAINKTAGTSTSILGNGAPVTNNSGIQADSGTLAVSTLTNNGTLTANTTATITFPGGPSFNNGTIFNGTGTFDIDSSATFAGNITATTSGVVKVRGAANTMTFNAATVTGTLTWKEAAIAGSGLTMPQLSTLHVVAGTGTPKLDGGSLTMAGTMNVGTTVGIRNGASFTLQSTGTVAINGDFDFGYDGTGATPAIGLSGLFGKTGGTGTSSVSCGGVCTSTATGTIGASSGSLAFPTGLTSNGTIKFAINGPTPLTDFGRIAVTGALTLAGTATAVVDPLYVPDGGTAFQVMTFGSVSGDFTTKSYTFAGTRTLIDTYSANDLTLFASGPTVATLNPATGGTGGGTAVTITGTGFTGTTAGETFTGSVTFDGLAASPVLWQSATELTATTPPHAAGTVDVTVTNANAEGHTAANAFTYSASVPVITALSVTSGTTGGGTYVEISGSNLSTVTDVEFGGVDATILQTVPTLAVRTPPGAAGTVSVTVTNGDGSDTLASAFTYAAPTCYPPASTMAWFRGEGDPGDSAGGTDGTNGGGYVAGRVGQAFDLDGTQHVSVPDSAWARGTDVTVEGWVKFDVVPAGTFAMLFGKTAGTGTFESYGVSYKDGLLYCGVGGPGGITYHTVAFTPSAGVWYHVAFTFDDAGDRVRLYVDGQAVIDASEAASIGYDSHPFTIGAEYENEALAFFFDGAIDEVALYPRALASAEVLAIYDADAAGKCFPASPLLLSIAPSSGPTAGGTAVTISGSSLSSPTAVTIGGVALAGVTGTQSQITGTTAAASAGTYNVDVTTAAGTAQLAGAFTYNAPASYTSVTSGNWTNPATWGAASYPQAGDTATVNHDVTVNANLTVAGVIVNGSGPRLSGAGTLTVTGSMTWNGGDISAPLLLDTGSTTSITGPAARMLAATATNDGTVTFDATGAFTLHSGAFTNNSVFNLQSDVDWQRFNSTTFTNNGTFNKSGGSGTGTWAGTFVNDGTMTLGSGTLHFTESFSNDAQVDLDAGTLQLSGSGASGGTFNTQAATVLHYSAGSHTFAGSLGGSGKLKVSGGTLSFAGTPSVTAMEMAGGQTGGAGTLTITTALVWTAGDLASSMHWGSGCTTQITGAAARALMGATDNDGAVSFSPTGTFTLHSNNLTNDGTCTVTGDVSVARFNATAFINNGTFNKSGGAATSTWAGTFTNNGTMSLGSGTLQFTEGFGNGNSVTVSAGELRLAGSGSSSGTFDTGAGSGVVNYSAGAHTLSGALIGSGTLLVSGAMLNISGAAAGASNLELTAGAIDGSGTLTVTGTFDWSGGDLNDSAGALILDLGSTTSITGTTPLTAIRAVTNSGTISYASSGGLTVHTASLTNSGTIDLQLDGAWGRFNAPVVVNTGTIKKSGGSGTFTMGVNVDNSGGTIDVESGAIAFTESHTANALSHYKSGIAGASSFGSMSFSGGGPNIAGAAFTSYLVGLFVPQGGQTFTVMSPVTGTFATTNTSFGAGRSFAVTYPGGTSVLLTASGPTVASVNPTSGSELGGTTVVITGTGFTNSPAPSVTFGGTAAPSVTFDSATQLTVTTPPHAQGTVDVVVTNSDGQPGTLTSGYTFNAAVAPTVTAIRPNTGNIAGGTTVYIDGTDLDTVTGVDFDGTAATIVAQSATLLEVLSPPHAAGSVPVVVTNPAGTASTSFTYNDLWDVARDFSRTTNPTGPWSYGHTPTRGGAFTAFTTTASAAGLNQWNLSGTVPAAFHNPTASTIIDGGDIVVPAGTFGFHPGAPEHGAVRWTAPSAGQWQISGSFSGIDQSPTSVDAAILVNGVQEFSALITAYGTPHTFNLQRSLAAGEVVEFTVDNFNGYFNDSTGLAATITPLAGPVVTVTGVSPAAGPTGGNQSVTIAGTNFHAGAAVLFDGLPATGVTVVNATTITAMTPAHAAGTVDVTVTHPDSADATLANGYAYTQAAVSIDKSAPANVAANEVFTYTITVTNAGPDAAAGVSVSDVMQAGMVPSNLSAPSFSCSGTGTLVCTAASLTTGSHTITFDVTAPSAPQAISNVVNLSAANDTTGGDDSDTAVTNVGAAEADLAVVKTVATPTVSLGGTVTWTVTVTNNGPSPATSVVITDDLPSGVTFTSATPSAGSCNPIVGNTVTCSVGSIAVGNSANVVLTATADEGGTRLNQATADSAETDPNNLNDVGTEFVTITGDSTLVVTNNNPAGTGSLAQAMLDADAGVCPSPCTITFNMPGAAPIPGPLPVADVLDLTIDGTTQPGYGGTPLIEIDGTSGNPGSTGLTIDGDGHVIRGLAIYGFTGPGAAGVQIIGGSHTVEQSYIGLKPDGTAAPNAEGVVVLSAGNTIGNADPSLANVISGNTGAGVRVAFGTGNSILGNRIGTGPDFVSPRGNATGVRVEAPAGATDIDDNTIAFNGTGVAVVTSVGVRVAGNLIHSNTGMAIDHDGDGVAEVLDAGDADTGSNNHQNAPVLSSVEITPSDLDVVLSVDSSAVAATQSIGIELYKSDPSGQPVEFLFGGCYGGNQLVNQLINAGLGSVAPGNSIVATATAYTDAGCSTIGDGTSEVSAPFVAGNCVPPAVTVTGPASTCAGDGVTLDAGAHTTYFWTPGNFTTATINVSPATTTVYTVTVTDASGCQNSTTHTVTVNSAPPVSISGPTSVCAGSSVTLTATGGFTSYLWQPGNLTGPSITVNPASTTTYTVSGTAAGGCTGTASHTVAVTPAPPATATAAGPTTFCDGGSVVLNASAGASYQWLPNGETTPSISVTASGTYSVVVTDGNGCSATSNSITVTVNPAPNVAITGPNATCTGTAVTLDAGAGFSSYLWTPGNFTTPSITVSPASTTVYSVTVINASGCSATDTHSVTVTSNPTATITAPAAVCSGSSGHAASVGAQPGATYTWSITNGLITAGSGTPSIVFQPTGTAPVQLAVTVATGSCTATGNATVNVSASPAAPVITAPANVPASTSGHTAGIAPQTGATYVWTIDGGTITSAANAPSITFASGTTSPITLEVHVNVNGCLAGASTTVVVDNVPPPADEADLSVTKSAPSSVAAGSTFTYSIGVTNAGPSAANNLSLTDALPSNVTVVGFDSGPWSCGVIAGQFLCSLPSMAPGSFNGITLTVTAPSQAATIVNSVSVGSATADPLTFNNADSVQTGVTVPPPSCPSAPPSLLSPANGATGVSSPVTLSWSAVSGATSYDVWLDTEGTTTLAGSTTTTSLTVTVGSGVTTWYVVAHGGSGCDPLPSAARTFTVPPSATCTNLGRPQLIAPAAGTMLSSPVTVSWTAVPQAAGYRVWISVNGAAVEDVGTTTGATQLTIDVPPGTIVVFVDALFNACPAQRSDGRAFEVPTPDPCAGRGAASLTAPANNATVNSSSVDLRWNAAPAVNGKSPSYRVWASVAGAPFAVLATTPETSVREVFERGQVTWFVESLYPGCSSVESPRFSFTIPARENCGNSRPALLGPSGTVSAGNVAFLWTAAADAIGYELHLALDGDSPALIATLPAGTTTFNYIVPAGELTWFVRALFDRCPSRDSQSGAFTFDPPDRCLANARPQPIAPLGGPAITSPAHFAWSAPAGAIRYELYLQRGNSAPLIAATTTAPEANGIDLENGAQRWFVRAFFNGCSPLDSAAEEILVVAPPAACAALTPPVVSAPGQISSGTEFLIQWTPAAGANSYQVQLASDANFGGAETITTAATTHTLVRTNTGGQPVPLYARARAIDSRCAPPTVTPYGPVSAVFVLPQTGSEGSALIAKPDDIRFTVDLGPELAGQTFAAAPNQPWLTVTPASGVVPAGGIRLVVTADAGQLGVGTNVAAVNVILNTASGRGAATQGTTSVTSTVSVNLVTPVTPTTKNTPPPDALVIPAVANASGINSKFQSDVRVSNTSPQLMKYQLTFTPSGETGISQGRQTTFSIEPGRTVALDDILKSWFGTGGVSATGMLEVRPLTQTAASTPNVPVGALANLATFASSRTFNVTPNGTFGQHIPAIPFANFIGKSANALAPTILSLQQIAQSDKYRTNFGFVEGSGESAQLLVKVFASTGVEVASFPVNLNGGQHAQLNGVLAQHGVTSLSDGRVEMQVVGGNGKVTAYASVLDNQTSDPLLVSPVTITEGGNRKWVVPGVADLNNGTANWQTDMRVFNAGTTDVEATLSFHSQNGGDPKTATLTIPAGQVRTLDRTLSTVFGASNDGGAVHIATPADARLIATARTYNQTTQGTYGQFISAVTPAEAAGVGTRALQLLQVEESNRFRSNIGLAEVTGNPVKLEITVVPPDAKFTAVAQLELGPNEFRQIGSLLRTVGLSDTYNARVTVRAIEGTGRVAAYASVIDAQTNDPTYVPAQ